MLWKIKDEIWFDSEKLFIIKGKENYLNYISKYKEYSEISTKSMRNKYPTIVFLSTTTCNLSCKYCFADSGTYGANSDTRFFGVDEYIYVYESALKQYGGVNAISFFGGEPMLNLNEIEKFVIYLHEHYKKIPIMAISSNGTIMNDHIKEFLEKYKIHFGTSLDGPKQYNDLNRVSSVIDSVYDTVENTLLSIKDLRIKKGLQMTISKEHVINYKRGEIVSWIKDLERLGVDTFELVPVTSDNADYKIDLKDDLIHKNFIQLCNDYADYCLSMLIKNEKPKAVSKIFISLILHIIKRVYQEDCSAGFSFCVSPDLFGYPCHVCASDKKFGIKFDENFKSEVQKNLNFQNVKNVEKKKISECNSCMAKNVCSYVCKGLSANNNYNLPEERCLMMEIFLKKVIIFLAESYQLHRKAIKNNIITLNCGGINV